MEWFYFGPSTFGSTFWIRPGVWVQVPTVRMGWPMVEPDVDDSPVSGSTPYSGRTLNVAMPMLDRGYVHSSCTNRNGMRTISFRSFATVWEYEQSARLPLGGVGMSSEATGVRCSAQYVMPPLSTAQSQPVQPVASTALTAFPLKSPTIGSSHSAPSVVQLESAGAPLRCSPKTGETGPPSALRMRIAANINVFPPELDRPELRDKVLTSFDWTTGFRAMGAVAGDELLGQYDRYAVFDVASHVQVRHLPRGWSINHLVAELTSLFPRLRSVHFLRCKLPHLPSVQVSVAMRDMPAESFALPVDFRAMEGKICTIRARPQLDEAALGRFCLQTCPSHRLPKRPFTLVDPSDLPLHTTDALTDQPDFGRGVERIGAMQPDEDLLHDDGAAPSTGPNLPHEDDEDMDDATFLQMTGPSEVIPGEFRASLSQLERSSRTSAALSHKAPVCPDLAPPWILPGAPHSPPALLGREGPARPTDLSKLGLSRVEVLPEDLARYPVCEIPVDQLGLYALEPGHARRVLKYSVLDRQRHHSQRTAAYGWSLSDLVSEAIRSSEESVRTAQVLTCLMPNLVAPQIVLTPAEAGPHQLCVPIDLRPLGGRPCTLLLAAGTAASEVITEAFRRCPGGPLFTPQAEDGRAYFLMDAQGNVWEELPGDLSQLQWLRIASNRPADLMQQDIQFGPGIAAVPPHTTLSTTWMLEQQQVQTVSFILAGLGITVRLHPQHISQARVADSVGDLVMAIARQRSLPQRARIILAAAQPMPLQIQHVALIFIIYPEDGRRHVILDPSGDGSMANSISVDDTSRPEELIGDAQRRQGFVAAVNGITQAAVRRAICTGDYVQVVQHPRLHRVSPTDWYYQIFPDLRLFAFPIEIPRLQRATAEPLNTVLQTQVRDGFLRYLRARLDQRADEMGRPSVDRQPVIVQGPHHAPALLYVPGRILRTLTEAEDDIIRTGLFMPGTSFADSCQLTHEHAPLFLSIPPGTRNIGLFVPAPAFFLGYHVVWVPPGTDPATLPLPVRKGFTLIYPGGIEHGATVRHSRIGAPNTVQQTSAGTGGTSLVQIQDERARQAKRCKALIRAHDLPRDCGCQAGVPNCDGRPAVTDVTSHAYDGGNQRDAEIHGATLACAAKEGPASLRPPGRQPIPTPLDRRKLPAPAKDWSAPPATPSHLPGVRCLKLNELLPGATARQGPGKLLLGVDADMEQFLFAQFGLQCFDPDWEAVNDVPPCARRFLKNLPQLPPDTRPQALQFYVDGSYYEHSKGCGWSICALALHQGLWTWVGHHTIRAQAAGSHHTLGAPVHSAYETELAAMAYTLAHCLSTDVPCAIGFDSTSAQAVASASCYDQQDSHLAQACRSMSHLLMLRDRVPLWMHVKAHSGHPLNEFVDAAAKSAARGEIAGQLPTALFEAQTSSTLAWLWAGSGLHPSVPAVLPNGALADADGVRPSNVGISDMCPVPPPLAANVSFDFRAATYNCLTLQSVSQQESLCSQFHRKGVAVVGLQETRTGTSGRSSNQHYHILHSPAADGQLGCQLWLSKSLAVARAGKNPVHWDGASMCIVCTTPRMLLATAKAGGITFAFAVAHSPTTKSGVTFCQKWWDSLHSALRRLPHNSVPMMFIDANAHNHDPVDHLVLRPDINVNQTGFADVVRAHSFCASGYVDVSGAPFYTWQGPGNQKACLDYVCCPDSLRAGMVVEGPLLDFVGHVDHDHKPVLTRIAWKQAGSLAAKKPRLEVEVLRTPAGKAALQQVYRQVPRIDWAASVDEHAYLLNAHIMRGLRHICPKLADRPRDPVTSDSTWQLIKDRRALRRVMHQVADRDEWQDYLVLLGEQVKDMTRLIRTSAKDDAARALRRSFHEARSQGVEALHRLCRRISKIGRRYRAPALCPALRQENGTVEEDSFRVLGDHFAEAERATHTTAEAIDTRGASYAAQDFPVANCLSVAGLARAFSGLSTRRAVGWSSLPAEAYQVAPLEAAHQHVALLLKCQLRRQCPLIWRGGVAVPIPKPNKPPHTTAGWRSILLLEPGAKAVARALRADLLQAFDCVRQPAQGGSRPKNPLPVASAHVKGLIKRIVDYKLCGGILFVDGQAAFYSLLREALLGTASCSDQDFIHALADAVFTKEEDRMRFVIQAMGPGLLASAAVPSAIQRFVAACLDNTWYCVGREPGHFYLTRTGSVPGAPLADLLFQLAFGRVLADISEQADTLGIRPLCPTAPGGTALPLPAPSWMDDVAFPVLADRPAELLERAGCMVQEVDAALHRAGIKVNFAPGKTRILAHHHRCQQ